MRMPSRVAAHMAGAVVAVVLTAAPGVAGTDDAPLLLLPEAAGEGAIGAPGDNEDSAIGGVPAGVVPAGVVPAEAVPAQAAAADARAAGIRAGNEEEAAAPDVPDTGRVDRAEALPEPASRLLRALAETPKAPASPGGSSAGAAPVYGTSVYAAEGCPRTLLRRLLAGAADDAGALTALGIEREVLTLCRERQELVTGLFETEARLKELRAPSEPPVPVKSAAVVAPQPAPAVRKSAAAGQAQPSPLRAALDRAASEPETPPAPRYGWFSIIGTAGALRAGVTDGTGVWFVREGDALPGGSTVANITGRPAGVRIAAPEGGDETALSWRALPGVGP